MMVFDYLNNNCEPPFFQKAFGYLPKDFAYDICMAVWSHGHRIKDFERPTIILETSHEEHELSSLNRPNCHKIFQHYYPHGMGSHEKICSMPLTYVGDYIDAPIIAPDKRRYDFVLMGQNGGHKQKFFYVAELLRQRGYKVFVHEYSGWNNGMPTREYAEIMRDSTFALCPHGTISPESFRLIEAICAGCIPISEPACIETGITRYAGTGNRCIYAPVDPFIKGGIIHDDNVLPAMIEACENNRRLYERSFSPEALARRIMENV